MLNSSLWLIRTKNLYSDGDELSIVYCIYVTGHGPSASAHGLWDLGELHSLTNRDSSFPRSTPGVVPSVPMCIQ